MTILYTIGSSLYVNITNKCPCNCTFCIRNEGDALSDDGSLWLEHEPDVSEIIAEFNKYDLSKYEEVVFCGFGEPLVRLQDLIEVCKYIRSISNITIRVNTNGLSDLIHKTHTAPMLKGVIDSISISLNAPSAKEYYEVSKPKFGIESFDAILKFAEEAKANIDKVMFSVVDEITPEQIERSKEIAKKMGIPLRVRHKA